MPRRRSWIGGLALVAGGVLLAGCPNEELTVAGTYDSMLAAICDKAHECRSTWSFPDGAFVQIFGQDPGQCETILGADPEFRDEPAAIQVSVDAGRIRFDPDAARECIDGVGTLTCPSFWSSGPDSPACARVFEGQVPDGGACTMSEDCAGLASECNDMTSICEENR